MTNETQLIFLKINFDNLKECNNSVLTNNKHMETSIIKIGNSRGLRLSKTILEKYNIKDKVELILEKGRIILIPINNPRKNWDMEFEKMNNNNDDDLLMNDLFDDENFDEWK